jgi:outer membrane protein
MMKKLGLIIFGLFPVLALSAQNRDLTFSDAVNIGLNDNAFMKNTRNNLRAYKTDKSAQISSFTPNLGITSGISQTSGPQNDPVEGRINTTTSSFGASIGSSLVIYNGNNRINSLKSSSYRLEGQELFIKRTEQDVINLVAMQFLQVLLDQELLKISEQNLITQERTLAEISGFVEAGSRPEVDMYRQDADVKSFELLVIQAKNTLTNDKAALAQTLQLDISQDFVVVRPDWNIDQIRVMILNLEELYNTALLARADYKRGSTTENAALYDFKRSFNGYLPVLSAFVTYGSTYFDPNDPNQNTDPFLTQIENRRSTSYGLNITIPIWDRLQSKNQRVFNKVTYENATNDLENLEKTIKIEVQTAYNNFNDVKAGYAVSLAQYDAAKLAYETQQESYSVGLATQVELAIANASFVSAQSNLAQTGYRLLFQKILLNYATGELTAEGINN